MRGSSSQRDPIPSPARVAHEPLSPAGTGEHAMKAIVQDRYGAADVLELREIDRPVAEEDDVLVRVRAASVHADVWHAVNGVPYVLRIMGSGVRKPKSRVPGTDLSGDVESVGRNVTRFRPGDEVFGQSLVANLWRNGGAYAEYEAAPESCPGDPQSYAPDGTPVFG